LAEAVSMYLNGDYNKLINKEGANNDNTMDDIHDLS
jgi:hypothetical protein